LSQNAISRRAPSSRMLPKLIGGPYGVLGFIQASRR
jgi:hypothetical protein